MYVFRADSLALDSQWECSLQWAKPTSAVFNFVSSSVACSSWCSVKDSWLLLIDSGVLIGVILAQFMSQ